MEVAALLLVSAATTGGLAGATLGLVWAAIGLPPVAAAPAVAVVAIALAADAFAGRTGRLRPPSSRHQVPRIWSRLFDPRTVAVLYGSRLGVGPLTILPTWTWWAASLLAASAGPAVSTVAGVAFGGGRIAVVLAASARAAPTPEGMATLRRAERPLVAGASVVAVVVAGAAALA